MTKFYEEYLASDVWKSKRLERLKIDGHQCTVCGSKSELCVHHITYNNLYEEKMEDLITLCKKCHREEHKNKKLRSTVPFMEMSYSNYIKTKNIIAKNEDVFVKFQKEIRSVGVMNIAEMMKYIGPLIIKLKSMRKINVLFVFLRNNYNIHLVYKYSDEYAEKYSLSKWDTYRNFFNNFICYAETSGEITEDWFCEKVQFIYKSLPEQIEYKKKKGYKPDSVDKEIELEGKLKIRQGKPRKSKLPS